MANTTNTRFVIGAKEDTTFRALGFDYQTPTYVGVTASFTIGQYQTFINLGSITQSVNITGTTASPLIGDHMHFIGIGPATGTSSVVFDTNVYKVNTTNTIAVGVAKNLNVACVYNGTYWVCNGFSI